MVCTSRSRRVTERLVLLVSLCFTFTGLFLMSSREAHTVLIQQQQQPPSTTAYQRHQPQDTHTTTRSIGGGGKVPVNENGMATTILPAAVTTTLPKGTTRLTTIDSVTIFPTESRSTYVSTTKPASTTAPPLSTPQKGGSDPQIRDASSWFSTLEMGLAADVLVYKPTNPDLPNTTTSTQQSPSNTTAPPALPTHIEILRKLSSQLFEWSQPAHQSPNNNNHQYSDSAGISSSPGYLAAIGNMWVNDLRREYTNEFKTAHSKLWRSSEGGASAHDTTASQSQDRYQKRDVYPSTSAKAANNKFIVHMREEGEETQPGTPSTSTSTSSTASTIASTFRYFPYTKFSDVHTIYPSGRSRMLLQLSREGRVAGPPSRGGVGSNNSSSPPQQPSTRRFLPASATTTSPMRKTPIITTPQPVVKRVESRYNPPHLYMTLQDLADRPFLEFDPLPAPYSYSSEQSISLPRIKIHNRFEESQKNLPSTPLTNRSYQLSSQYALRLEMQRLLAEPWVGTVINPTGSSVASEMVIAHCNSEAGNASSFSTSSTTLSPTTSQPQPRRRSTKLSKRELDQLSISAALLMSFRIPPSKLTSMSTTRRHSSTPTTPPTLIKYSVSTTLPLSEKKEDMNGAGIKSSTSILKAHLSQVEYCLVECSSLNNNNNNRGDGPPDAINGSSSGGGSRGRRRCGAATVLYERDTNWVRCSLFYLPSTQGGGVGAGMCPSAGSPTSSTVEEVDVVEPVQTSMVSVPLWPSSRHDLFLLEPSTSTTTTTSESKDEGVKATNHASIRKEDAQNQDTNSKKSGRPSAAAHILFNVLAFKGTIRDRLYPMSLSWLRRYDALFYFENPVVTSLVTTASPTTTSPSTPSSVSQDDTGFISNGGGFSNNDTYSGVEDPDGGAEDSNEDGTNTNQHNSRRHSPPTDAPVDPAAALWARGEELVARASIETLMAPLIGPASRTIGVTSFPPLSQIDKELLSAHYRRAYTNSNATTTPAFSPSSSNQPPLQNTMITYGPPSACFVDSSTAQGGRGKRNWCTPRDDQLREVIFLKEPPAAHYRHGKGGAWKPGQILYFLSRWLIGVGPRYALRPDHKPYSWFYIIDDDTYFIPQNLNGMLRAHFSDPRLYFDFRYHSNSAYTTSNINSSSIGSSTSPSFSHHQQPRLPSTNYIAPPLVAGMRMPWAENVMKGRSYMALPTSCIQGGAGIQMNTAAVIALAGGLNYVQMTSSSFFSESSMDVVVDADERVGLEKNANTAMDVATTTTTTTTAAASDVEKAVVDVRRRRVMFSHTDVPQWAAMLPSQGVVECFATCSVFQFGDVRQGCCATALNIAQRAIPGFYWLPPNEYKPRGIVKETYRELALREFTLAGVGGGNGVLEAGQPGPMLVGGTVEVSVAASKYRRPEAEGALPQSDPFPPFGFKKRLSVDRSVPVKALLAMLPNPRGAQREITPLPMSPSGQVSAADFSKYVAAISVSDQGEHERLKASVRTAHPTPLSFHKAGSPIRLYAIHMAATTPSSSTIPIAPSTNNSSSSPSLLEVFSSDGDDTMMTMDGGGDKLVGWEAFDVINRKV